MGRVATIRQRNADYQVTWRSVEQLIPYARNARTHSDEQVAQIAASVREFGWTNPVLVDEADGIIAGHGRVMAARKLGMDQVPVIVLSGLTEAQKRAYIIADNKLALNAGWDEEMLRAELADLRESGFDVNLTGFDPDEIAELDGTEDPPKLYTDKMQTPVYESTLRMLVQPSRTDFGQAQAITQTVTIDVLPPMVFEEPEVLPEDAGQPAEPEPETTWQKFWRFLLGLLGLSSGRPQPAVDGGGMPLDGGMPPNGGAPPVEGEFVP